MPNASSAPEPSVGVGLELVELEDVVVVAGVLDGTLLVVGGGEVVEVVVGV